MSVKLRKYQGGDDWEVDIRVQLPDGTVVRERKKAPVTGRTAVLRWAEARERVLVVNGKPARQKAEVKPVATLAEFSGRFLEGYARANRQKPSGISSKECILRVHLVPLIGDKPLNAITTEDVQKVKSALIGSSPKTVNNVLTVLSVAMKTAVEWGVIDRVPCSIKLLRAPKSVAAFHDFSDFEKLVAAAKDDGPTAQLIVLLGGEAGLRCGEIMALEWRDVDLANRQLSVARSEWKGHVTAPKGGRVRHVPLTEQLSEALKAARHLRGARVICDEKGRPLTQKIVQVTVRRIARRARVKPGVHILRHTFCSHLAMKGAPARAIQELAGHQDLTTTQRYMHLTPAALDAAIGLLNKPGPTKSGPAKAGHHEKPGHYDRGEIVEAAGNRA
jgi:integrase